MRPLAAPSGRDRLAATGWAAAEPEQKEQNRRQLEAYLTRCDIYANVIWQTDGVTHLRFTSFPPEILTYFDAGIVEGHPGGIDRLGTAGHGHEEQHCQGSLRRVSLRVETAARKIPGAASRWPFSRVYGARLRCNPYTSGGFQSRRPVEREGTE
jgi:hypothetical protein